MNDQYKLFAYVRCVCGARVEVETGQLVKCPGCGGTIEVRKAPLGQVRPWVVIPDGYDLADRKNNKPNIEKIWWA